MQRQKPAKNNLIKTMTTTLFALCLFFAGLQQSHAQAKLPNPATTTFTKEEQEILDLSKTKWTWMSDKNVESLDGLFKENCVFVHMGGSWGKKQELDVIELSIFHPNPFCCPYFYCHLDCSHSNWCGWGPGVLETE